ncbi:related to protein kinase RAD53 [Rhynchosporium agropyri]|uniref:non-specific serine/threonine protein kinase n=1 Tax=Rhynchosporium agropyri TaxID=914238 RepID=A0A1E1KQZ3_9HELO|nr:related to protein kinase RAD53 [Rhynchosporium agropyri]
MKTPDTYLGPSQPTQPTQPCMVSSSTSFAFTPQSSLHSPSTSPTYSQNPNADDPYWVATQLVTDPRRLGQPGSGLNDDQLADIFCILHPATLPACRAAALIRECAPENTITTDHDVRIREKTTSLDEFNSTQLAQDGLVSCDIALRLTCNLKDPMGGFQFGRNAARCDFVLGRNEPSRRVSNIHFRIYINEYGSLMLEDQSTNGTAVDGVLLRAKDKENGLSYRHTLSQGSIITLTMTPPEEDYRFVVRIPHREGEHEDRFQQNLTVYFLRMGRATNGPVAIKGGGTSAGAAKELPIQPNTDPVPNLFPNPKTQENPTPNHSVGIVGKTVREWKGGNKYNRVGTIGKGAFATVYKITEKFDGKPYAAKELEKRRFMKNGILDLKVENEMKIMQRITHDNIVKYIEHVDFDDRLYIIMEFVPGGDLGSLVNEFGPLPELQVKSMASQLLSALKYLHHGGITHRDVKPDNILIHSRDPFHVKLTDFGLSKMITSEETFLRTFCGTLLYCAPEVYSEYREYDGGTRNHRRKDKRALPPQRYGQAVDIWSLAGVLFYSLCGYPPYPVKNGTSYQELLNQIMTNVLDIRPLQRVHVSENGISFVKSMLQTNPEYRATIDELQVSDWFLGVNAFDSSMEEEEVDLVGNGHLDPELEEGTSQLSINPNNNGFDEDEDMLGGNRSDMTEIQRYEISNSFSTSEGNSNGIGSESYAFLDASNNHADCRLFGEVSISAVGSSGVIPSDHLNLLPLPTDKQQSVLSKSSRDSRYTQSPVPIDLRTLRFPLPPSAIPTIMHLTKANKNPRNGGGAIRESSLMGAESMVGHLHMQSPAAAPSPDAESLLATTEEIQDVTMSLRRPREEDYDDNGIWIPTDLPAKRRRKSEREIDLVVPPSTFWDPKDKATHHNNYPKMLTSDFMAYQDFAESKGEKFTHGQKTFEFTMESFRSSSSSCSEPERAQSEPTKAEGRRILLKRDDRQLASNDNLQGQGSPSNCNPTQDVRDISLVSTAHPSRAPTMVEFKPTPPPSYPQPVVGNDFQPPKRILAKFVSTLDSCLPTISLNITDSVTSWGRGYEATVRYANGQEIRIPKYAFKIFLFKPGYYNSKQPTFSTNHVWHEKDQDMKFFISTKASSGIWVNGVNVPCHDRQDPSTQSRYWGELKYGDIVTVWQAPEQQTRLKFECYWGKSKEIRNPNSPFEVLPEDEYLNELDEACLFEEKAILDNNHRREKEEKKMSEREKRAKLSRSNKSIKHDQSTNRYPITQP